MDAVKRLRVLAERMCLPEFAPVPDDVETVADAAVIIESLERALGKVAEKLGRRVAA